MALSSLIVCALKLYPSYDVPPRRSVATYSRDERMPQASRIVRSVPRSDGSVVILAPSAKVAHRSRVRFKVARWTLPVCRRSMRGRSDISRRPKHPERRGRPHERHEQHTLHPALPGCSLSQRAGMKKGERPLGMLLSQESFPFNQLVARGVIPVRDGCSVCCSCRSCGRPLRSGCLPDNPSYRTSGSTPSREARTTFGVSPAPQSLTR